MYMMSHFIHQVLKATCVENGTCSSCAYRGVITDAALKVDAANEQVNAGVVPMPPRDAQLDAVNRCCM